MGVIARGGHEEPVPTQKIIFDFKNYKNYDFLQIVINFLKEKYLCLSSKINCGYLTTYMYIYKSKYVCIRVWVGRALSRNLRSF